MTTAKNIKKNTKKKRKKQEKKRQHLQTDKVHTSGDYGSRVT